ncbi:hypothetical protein BMS3Bbin16_01159 [archaeon BMS3Bbin16]|nr:hypothetical protein BMS3Bbin16_01159 [archaeon BMS3Bbin16]
MSVHISIKELQEKTGIKFVSSGDVIKTPTKKSYKTLEIESESETHTYMKKLGIEYFDRLDYKIYPEGIGVKGVFTFADFLAYKEGRIVFVECLMDNNINVETIMRKSQLSEFGEMCFVIVGGSGYSDPWVNDCHEISSNMIEISTRTDILLYFYGHFKNDFEKKVSSLTPFPKVSFDIKRDESLRVKILFKIKRKTCDISLFFIIKPYRKDDELKYLQAILSRFSWMLLKRKDLRSRYKSRLYPSRTKIKINDIKSTTVASGEISNSQITINFRGSSGLEILRELLLFLKNMGLTAEYDENDFKVCEEKLSASEDPSVQKDADPIESNLYPTDQIVWILNHFFNNKPTRVSDFVKYLPENILFNINYWLRRGVELRHLERTDDGERRVKNRIYVATKQAIDKVEKSLNETHYTEIPGKSSYTMFQAYVKHKHYFPRKKYVESVSPKSFLTKKKPN